MSQRLRASVVRFAQPGQLFEDLGITYIGVVPGHDLRALLETLGAALALPGPTIVHVRTQKGRGFRPAERTRSASTARRCRRSSLAPGTDAYDGAKGRGRGRSGVRRRDDPGRCRRAGRDADRDRWPTTPPPPTPSPRRRRRTRTTPRSSPPS